MSGDPPPNAKYSDLLGIIPEFNPPAGYQEALDKLIYGSGPSDAERMEWLSQPGREVGMHRGDWTRADLTPRKSVSFFVRGTHTTVDGETLREAIDAAMALYAKLRAEAD